MTSLGVQSFLVKALPSLYISRQYRSQHVFFPGVINKGKALPKMKNSNDVVELLRSLVQINTCQPEGNEKELVDFLKEIFAPYGDAVKMNEISHSDERSSLVVRLGPDLAGGIAFVGHVDTVPVGDLNKWSYDPHAAESREGKMVGRGTCDMKGGVAAMTVAALDCLESGMVFEKPLYLTYTADEEQDGMGAKAVVESQLLEKAPVFVIPEPTDNKIAIAEKGCLWLRIQLEGKIAHGSKPEVGINAVEAAIDLAKNFKAALPRLERHKLLGEFTCAVTRLEGGIMTNIIPELAVIEMDLRTLPVQEHAQILDILDKCSEQIREAYPGLAIKTEVLKDFLPVETDEDDDFVQFVQKHVKAVGLPDQVHGMTYATDAADIVKAYPRPFVIIGPGHESMAHQVDETVKLDSLFQAVEVYKKLIQESCAS